MTAHTVTLNAVTLNPMLPLWVLLPLVAGLAAFSAWQLVRHRNSRRAIDWASRLLMVLLLLLLALRPAIPGSPSGSTATGGLEVYFVVDTTSSMAAEDFGSRGGQPGQRLDGVKSDIAGIVRQLLGAEFALVTFDSQAVQRVPLTTDASAVLSATSVLTQEATLYSTGSSIDAPLELLKAVLADANAENPQRPRMLFYFGDGEQTTNTEPQPFEELAEFTDGGAVLGYGTESGGRMREFSGYQLEEGQVQSYIQDFTANPPGDAISRIDEENLRAVASQLGVDYEHRRPGEPVGPLVSGITVPPSSRDTSPGELPTEFYWIFALPLGLLALRELFAVASAIRALPRGAG